MAFDPYIPREKTPTSSEEIRNNFLGLAIHHRGVAAPANPQIGYIWLDVAEDENWKLRQYTKNQSQPAVWVTLFEHVESTPSAPGGGGAIGATGDTGATGPTGPAGGGGGGGTGIEDTTWDQVYEFDQDPGLVRFNEVPCTLTTPVGQGCIILGIKFVAAGIIEDGPYIRSDPLNMVASTGFDTNSQGNRTVDIFWNDENVPVRPSTGICQIEWTWNGIKFTVNLTVSKLASFVITSINPSSGEIDTDLQVYGGPFDIEEPGRYKVRFYETGSEEPADSVFAWNVDPEGAFIQCLVPGLPVGGVYDIDVVDDLTAVVSNKLVGAFTYEE